MGSVRRLAKQLSPPSIPNAKNDWESITAHTSDRINILWSYFSPRISILFLPERPPLGSLAYKLSRLSGCAINVDEQTPYDVVFKLEDKTFSDSLSSAEFDVEHVINGQCTNISKNHVNATFEKVFGYPLGVDPAQYDGAMVVKSNENSTHDGTVVKGPLSHAKIHSRNTYQKAIDNTTENGEYVLDYRVPIHGNNIPLVYLKYRPVPSRFANENSHVTLSSPEEVFSEAERNKIKSFTRHLQMDFGELDVLRDGDGRLYVVDANSTPFGPPNGLAQADHKQALRCLKTSFEAFIRGHTK